MEGVLSFQSDLLSAWLNVLLHPILKCCRRQSTSALIPQVSTLFSFLLLPFTTRASCLLTFYTCFYVHELCISLCLLLFCIMSSMWVIVPAKPWWSIETFGMLSSSKDGQNGRAALVVLWKPARCACFLFLFFKVCPALIIIQCFLLSAFSQSGYLLSAVCPIHWFVYAYHFMLCFNSLPSNSFWVMRKMLRETFPSHFRVLCSYPF